MEFADDQDAPTGQQEDATEPKGPKVARTDVLLMMSMAINVFLAVLVAWWAVIGTGGATDGVSARNVERDISRLNAAIERLERTVERKVAEAESMARARELSMQAGAGASGQPLAGSGAEDVVPKTHRVLLPDGRLVIKTVP